MKKLLGNNRSDLFKTEPTMRTKDITLEFVMDSMIIHGTPEQVTEKILAFRDVVGPFGTLVYAGHDWSDFQLSKRSMELMAKEVIPAVNKTLREFVS